MDRQRIALAVLGFGLVALLLAYLLKELRSPAVKFVEVAPGVRLEVVDWGGEGRPVVLLAGLGRTARNGFGNFAPKLTKHYRVYGITRRGFSPSSIPANGYSADRLGDDVLAVLDALEIERPVLIGHSIAGQELSSIGSRFPDRVAGLIYLDAAYHYAYYAPEVGEYPALPDEILSQLPFTHRAIFSGRQRYTNIGPPILALYATPPAMDAYTRSRPDPEAELDKITKHALAQLEAFKRRFPSARVVNFPGADHFLHISNESDVLREIDAFIEGLPQ